MDGSTECNRIMLFKPSNWLAKITAIKHLSLVNNLLMVVLAEYHGGKSSFASLLAAELSDSLNPPNPREQVSGARNHTLLLQANTTFTTAIFVNLLSSIVDMPQEPSSLAEVFEQVNAQKKHYLVIIDDAQQLPTSILEELLWEIKQQEPAGFLHFCLISDYTILSELYALATQAFEDKIHTIELGPLSESETRTYLINKTATPKVSNNELTDFYQKTQGNLARMNAQLSTFGGGLQSLTRRRRTYRSTLISMLLFVTGVCFYWQDLRQEEPVAVIDPPSLAVVTPIEVASVEPLTSAIPFFVEAAQRQFLEPSMRNVLADVDDNPEDTYIDNLVVLDKVVVLPKNLSTTLVKKEPANLSLSPEVKAVPHYTIQLLASKQKPLLEKLIHTHPLKKDLKISKLNKNGDVWYVITMGKFAKKSEAELFMSQLSNDLLTFKPWIRPTNQLKALG